MADQTPNKITCDLLHSGSDSEMSTEGASASVSLEASNVKAMESDSDVHSTVDRLLERNRNEIMFELRRMQLGDRPVTGQGNKEALETLIQRHIESPINVEEHRPEAVIVEVQGLVQSRPVSSILGTGFRRRLENALRSSFQTVSTRHQTSSRTTASSLHTSAETQQLPPGPSAQTVQSRRIPAPPPESVRSQDSSGLQEIPPPPPISQFINDTTSSELSPPDTGDEPRQTRAAAWLNRQDTNIPEDPQERLDLSVHDHFQEELIEEISELVQRQLVTQTLDGDFRSTLELRVANHLSNTGTDGHRVQQFIRSLPRSDVHMRNDFTHLGIQGHAPQAAGAGAGSLGSDEMSVISATAAVHVSQNHVSRAVSLELSSLRSQVNELKEMMKMSFNLQLDIQRAIRQEVAAVVSAAVMDTPIIQERQQRSRPVNDSNCLICLDRATDSVLYQCGHMCVCYTCGMNLKDRGLHCPMCRAPIRDIIRAYRCSVEDN